MPLESLLKLNWQPKDFSWYQGTLWWPCLRKPQPYSSVPQGTKWSVIMDTETVTKLTVIIMRQKHQHRTSSLNEAEDRSRGTRQTIMEQTGLITV